MPKWVSSEMRPYNERDRWVLFTATSRTVEKEGTNGQYTVPDKMVTELSGQARDGGQGRSK